MKEFLMTPGFCLSHSIWGISLTKMRETKEGWVWGDNEHEHVKSKMPKCKCEEGSTQQGSVGLLTCSPMCQYWSHRKT